MAYSYPEIKSFKGLFLQANSFTVPDGALEDCNNAVIARDGIISKLRGWYSYSAPATGTLRALFTYKSTLLSAFADKLTKYADAGSAPNKTGTSTDMSGVTVAITTTPRFEEQNNNVYVTTDNGVVKLESITGTVMDVGVPPALDVRGFLLPLTGGITGDNEVGYRVVFGRRDANNNLYLGSPSDIMVLTNAKVVGTTAKVVGATWARSGGGPYTVTVTSALHNLSSSMVVTASAFSGTDGNGDHTITFVDANSFSWSQATDPGVSGTLDYVAPHAVRLEASIPSEIVSTAAGWLVQIYRSSLSGSTLGIPNLDFGLIDEFALTAAQIAAKLFVYEDSVPDLFRGAELYTNPGSREGEAQANDKPPQAKDICLFKNHLIYAAAINRHFLGIDLVAADAAYINAGDWFETKVGTAAARRYIARTGLGNDIETLVGSGTGTITFTRNTHGLLDGYTVYVNNITGTLPVGEYVISGVTPNTFDVTLATMTCTQADVSGLSDGTGNSIFQLYQLGTVSVNLRETAIAMVRAINRDPSSVLYANYASTPLDVPGKVVVHAKGFGSQFSMRAVTTTVGQAFAPALPDSFSTGVQVSSQNDDLQNVFYSSKVGEPEAVPAVNYFPVGSRNKKILRAFALRDSIIFLKEDGVWRCDGDSTSNFTVTALDKTANCVAPDSASVINNQVVFLSNQGVCLVSSNSVRIVSRDIETPIRAILGSSVLAAQTSGATYESERLYYLTTIKPGSTTADVTYVYNTLSDGWSTCDMRILSGVVGPGDIFFHVDRSNVIQRERKTFDRTDFCGQNYSVTMVSVATDKLSAVITVAGTPQIGGILVYNGVINRIVSVTAVSSNFSVVFKRATNIIMGNVPIMYQPYKTSIKTAPFHGGAVGRSKQFAQMSLHIRDNSVSDLQINFGTQLYGSSAMVDWSASSISAETGWGLSPWGLFGWGMIDGIESKYQTQPAPAIRVYVPILAQRGSFLQPIIDHNNAGEEINLQAMTFAVRGYGERVSK